MAVKVVYGSDRFQGQDIKSLDNRQSQIQNTQNAAQQSITRAVSTDAVIISVRSQTIKSTGNISDIKDYPKAKEVAKDVADKIRDDEDKAKDAHGDISKETVGKTNLATA